MSDVAEGLGAAIEGSLAAGSVQPADGTSPKRSGGGADEETECANCRAPLTGPYCNQCGQKAHVHRTLSAIGHDLMHGVLHLDGKLAHTLPLLAFKPGSLTRRYIEGERARFVSPMAMFLFSVFAMFAVFQMVGFTTPTSFELETGVDAIEARVVEAVAKNEAELAKVDSLLEQKNLDPAERRNLERRKSELETELYDLEQIDDLPFINSSNPAASVGDDGKRVVPIGDSDNARLTYEETGFDFIDIGLIKKWRNNPGLMIYKLQANAYKFSWLLIPLSIPFIWLIFAWKRRFKAYDHAIFVTYSLAFMSLLFIAVSVAGVMGAPTPLVVFSVLLIPPIHLYKQLRGAYELSRFSALWRLAFVGIFIIIVMMLFLQALIVLGAF